MRKCSNVRGLRKKGSTLLLLGAGAAAIFVTCMAPAPARAEGQNYYVNNLPGSNCSDTGPGTSVAVPWCSFTPINAKKRFSAGDTILLARGATWNQEMDITGTGTSSAWITVGAYGSGAAPKVFSNGSDDSRAITVTNGDYVAFRDLEVGYAAAGIHAFYTTLGHRGLSFENISTHDVYGIEWGRHLKQGNYVPSAEADHLWVSSGIAITGNIPSHGPNDTALEGVRAYNIRGTHNANTFYIDFSFGDGQISPNLGGSGTAGQNLVKNVTVTRLSTHDSDHTCSESVRFFTVSHVVMADSIMDNEIPCYNNTGTTGVIIAHASDVTLANNMFKNFRNTGSYDQSAIDHEVLNDNVKVRNNAFLNTPGGAIEYLQLSGRPGDYQTNHEASGNLFVNNGYANNSGGAFYFVNAQSYSIGATIKDNINVNPKLIGNVAGNISGVTTSNIQTIASGTVNVWNSAADYSGIQGQSYWSYQVRSGDTYSQLNYNSETEKWTAPFDASLELTQFDIHPGASSATWAARAWRAPNAGTVSVRGRILKSDNAAGGNGVLARITKNGAVIWPTSGGSITVAAGDEYTGVDASLDSLAVEGGDVIRFEVANNGNNIYDLTSWVPTVAYTAQSARALGWGFLGGPEGWYAAGTASISTEHGTPSGTITVNSYGNDPYIISPDNLGVSASANKTIYVRLANATSNTSAQIFFTTTSDTVFTEAKSVRFAVTANSGMTTYAVNMGSSSSWAGTIKQLRLDPVETSGSVSVDALEITR
jgi:hypothetical protein